MSSHLYAVTRTSNQLCIDWQNQDELQKIKKAQKLGFFLLSTQFCSLFWLYSMMWLRGEIDLPTNLQFPTLKLNYNWPSSRKIQNYIYGKELSSKVRVFCLFYLSFCCLLILLPSTWLRDAADSQQAFNSQSLNWTTFDQVLERFRTIYREELSSKARVFLPFYLSFCCLLTLLPPTRLRDAADPQQAFDSRPPNWTTFDQALERSGTIYIGKNWAQKPGFFVLPELLLPSDPAITDMTTRHSWFSTSLQFPTPELNYIWSSSRKIQNYI